MGTQDQYVNRLIVDGEDLGTFDTWDGGAGDSSEVKYNEAGAGPEVTLGGRPTLENVTLGRLNRLERDHALIKRLYRRRGKARCVAIRQPTDAEGVPFGDPYIYNGRLKTVTPGKTDSNATAADVWTVVVSVEGDIG